MNEAPESGGPRSPDKPASGLEASGDETFGVEAFGVEASGGEAFGGEASGDETANGEARAFDRSVEPEFLKNGPARPETPRPPMTRPEPPNAAPQPPAKTRRRALIVVVAAVTLLAMAAGWLLTVRRAAAEREALFQRALVELQPYVRGEEALVAPGRPPVLADLAGSRAQGAPYLAALGRGAEAFLAGGFDQAQAAFEEAGRDRPPEPRLLSLQAAAHLRRLNYGQAADLYRQAAALPRRWPQGPLETASDRLGLALCLFHLGEPAEAHREASTALAVRRRHLGRLHPEALSALNLTATSLLALGRDGEAAALLEETFAEIAAGDLSRETPAARDGLGILALIYESRGDHERLAALLNLERPAPPKTAETARPPSSEAPPPVQAQLLGPDAQAEGLGGGPAANADQNPPDKSADKPAVKPPLKLADPAAAQALLDQLAAQAPASPTTAALAAALVETLGPSGTPPCSPAAAPYYWASSLPPCLTLAETLEASGQTEAALKILQSLAAAEPALQPAGRPTDAAPAASTAVPTAASTAGPAAKTSELQAAGQAAERTAGPPDRPARLAVLERLARVSTAAGRPETAEAALRAYLALAAEETPLSEAAVDQIILKTLALADNLLARGRPGIEAELELVAAQTKLRRLTSAKALSARPLAAVLQMRLAVVCRELGRDKDSRAAFDQAAKNLKAAARAGDGPEIEVLRERLAAARRTGRQAPDFSDLYSQWGGPTPVRRAAEPGQPAEPAAPEILRLELAALKLLGRTEEFRPTVENALAWSAAVHGPESAVHRRLLSLRLKFLEESGDYPGLLAALDELAAQTGPEPSRTAVRSSALRFKARTLRDLGRADEAVEALRAARTTLAQQPGWEERLKEVEAELAELTGRTSGTD
ncbi:MAG: tetratricopeptide repeat protein [Deltaproteobacteria bacterium]|nr:tetratricopeptide repeat protein [Deltaproteobacteria bacterium]